MALNAEATEAVRQWVELDMLVQNLLADKVLRGEVVRLVVGGRRQEQLIVIEKADTGEPTRPILIKRYPVQVP